MNYYPPSDIWPWLSQMLFHVPLALLGFWWLWREGVVKPTSTMNTVLLVLVILVLVGFPVGEYYWHMVLPGNYPH